MVFPTLCRCTFTFYAEALNEWKHGPTDEAYEAINMVRRRGFGNPSKTSICDLKDLNEEDFRKKQSIKKELMSWLLKDTAAWI